MFKNIKFISRFEQDISLILFAHSWDILFNTRNKFHTSTHYCVCIAWYKHEGVLGKIPNEGLHINTFKFFQTTSRFCITLCKHKACIFYFFYKIRLRNVTWRHNFVYIVWSKHCNWAIYLSQKTCSRLYFTKASLSTLIRHALRR